MSRSYPLTPVEMYCPSCNGFGRVVGSICSQCEGIGRVPIAGGPLFGCKTTLADAKPGQIASIGNGDRGRVVRHCRRGTPTTEVAVIDPMLETESAETTSYPSATGVVSLSCSTWFQDSSGDARGKEDHLDPLQRKKNSP